MKIQKLKKTLAKISVATLIAGLSLSTYAGTEKKSGSCGSCGCKDSKKEKSSCSGGCGKGSCGKGSCSGKDKKSGEKSGKDMDAKDSKEAEKR